MGSLRARCCRMTSFRTRAPAVRLLSSSSSLGTPSPMPRAPSTPTQAYAYVDVALSVCQGVAPLGAGETPLLRMSQVSSDAGGLYNMLTGNTRCPLQGSLPGHLSLLADARWGRTWTLRDARLPPVCLQFGALQPWGPLAGLAYITHHALAARRLAATILLIQRQCMPISHVPRSCCQAGGTRGAPLGGTWWYSHVQSAYGIHYQQIYEAIIMTIIKFRGSQRGSHSSI